MSYLLIFTLSSFLSASAIGFLFFRKIKQIRSDKELYERALKLSEEPLLKDYSERLRLAMRENIKKVFLNARVLRIAEILTRRIRIIVLKIENFLFRIIDYLNGRRKISANNGNSSPFLKELNDSKNHSPDKNENLPE